MIGVGMRLQHPLDPQRIGFGGLEDRIGRCRGGLAGTVIEVEHRINHSGALGCRVGHQIADSVGGLIEEGLDGRGDCHGNLFALGSVVLLDLYISEY